jgi:CDP-diacylglycerol--serine O-phosphatidyltransferase
MLAAAAMGTTLTPRWRYALPNVVTCISLTAALLAINEAIAARFDSAAWFILLCVLLDKLDGTVARALGASSRFGIELDSLSDLCGFGVAPAVLMLAYLVGRNAATPLAPELWYRIAAYAGCLLYVIGAALRLAKFNVLTDIYGKEFFFGIPTTLCGALTATWFLTARKHGLPAIALEIIPAVMLVLALAMVSRIPLPKVRKRKTLTMNVVQITNVVLVYTFAPLRLFPAYLFAVSVLYVSAGTAWALAKGIKPPPIGPDGQPIVDLPQASAVSGPPSPIPQEELVAAENLSVGESPLVQVEREK